MNCADVTRVEFEPRVKVAAPLTVGLAAERADGRAAIRSILRRRNRSPTDYCTLARSRGLRAPCRRHCMDQPCGAVGKACKTRLLGLPKSRERASELRHAPAERSDHLERRRVVIVERKARDLRRAPNRIAAAARHSSAKKKHRRPEPVSHKSRQRAALKQIYVRLEMPGGRR